MQHPMLQQNLFSHKYFLLVFEEPIDFLLSIYIKFVDIWKVEDFLGRAHKVVGMTVQTSNQGPVAPVLSYNLP